MQDDVMELINAIYDPTEEEPVQPDDFDAHAASGGNCDDAFRMGEWRGKYELARRIYHMVYGSGR